jgi:hypothetical protein
MEATAKVEQEQMKAENMIGVKEIKAYQDRTQAVTEHQA